jgi:glycosyltransferase involved in cell wall biosynthesis
METHVPEIGYILKGYPRTSETFITNEIYLLEEAGLRLSIFSLKRLEGQKRHGVVNRIKATTTYLPETTPSDEVSLLAWLWKNVPGFAGSHWKLFRARTVAYLSSLLETSMMSLKYWDRGFVKEFLQAGFIAQQVLESGRIRHLHAHFCHTTTTVTMLASKMCGAPFSFTAHAKDIYREDMNPGDLLSVKMRRAKFVVTCTKANQEYLDRFRPAATPLYAIYHGLDLALFNRSKDVEPRFPPLILSVGRMVEKKGFTYLVEACRILKDRGYEFECRIVGGADQFAETIKNLIEQLKLDHVVSLHDAVTQEELRLIYEEATIFALPCQVIENGDRDGIPNVLVEAMAMELPVVSTEISGIPELIDHRFNGLLVPERDSEALAAAIEELLNSRELRLGLGRAACEKVRSDFDAQKNVLRLKEVFVKNLESTSKQWALEGRSSLTKSYRRWEG